MDLLIPGNGLLIWQVLGLALVAFGAGFFAYVGYLAVKALQKYTAKS
jgi:hypothetical protein